MRRDDGYINDDYITRIIKAFFKKKLIGIDLSKSANYNIPRQFNFIEKNSGI